MDEQVRAGHADGAGVEDEAQEWPVPPLLHVQRKVQVGLFTSGLQGDSGGLAVRLG